MPSCSTCGYRPHLEHPGRLCGNNAYIFFTPCRTYEVFPVVPGEQGIQGADDWARRRAIRQTLKPKRHDVRLHCLWLVTARQY